jgi:uncharacterized protein (TIRG00374 family)
MSRLRGVAVVSAKSALGIGLIWWLLVTDIIDLRPLASISLTFAIFGLLLGFTVTALWTVRMRALLRAQSISVGYLRCFRVNAIGLFYSLFLPGGVSGDAARAVYFFKDAPSRRPAVLGALMIDRFIGLITLIALGLASGVILVSSMPQIAPWLGVAFASLLFLLVMLFFLLRYELAHRESCASHPLFKAWERLRSIFSRLNLKDYQATTLLTSAVLSVAMNAVMITLTYYCSILHQANLDLYQVAAVSPLGLMTNAIPLSPGGLGVGEKSFDILFRLVGGINGATTFLVTRVFLYSPAILGGVFVAVDLFLRGHLGSSQSKHSE